MDAARKSADRAGISVRAMLVGAVLCGAIAVGLPYGEFVLNGTQLGLNSLDASRLFSALFARGARTAAARLGAAGLAF